MTTAQGETAVTTSALVVTGLYAYRKTTEGLTKAPKAQTGPFKAGLGSYVEAPLGVGELAPLGAWATGMGLTFIILSIVTSVNATFGGSFAILVGTGAVIANGKQVFKDLGHALPATTLTPTTMPPEAPQTAVSSNHPPTR